jgi:peptidoglycan/xylan/chitin deacetylase (PgdA/CDA1 family)
VSPDHYARRRLRAGAVVLALGAAALALIDGPGGGGRRATPPAGGSAAAAIPLVARAGPSGGAAAAAVDRTLARTGYLVTGSSRRREIALTFDDGPGPATLAVLAVLHRARAPATFFETGRSTRIYPRIERRVLAAGLPIGDHTETHPLLTTLSSAGQQAEIIQGAQAIQSQGAPYPRLFRPPYGGFNAATTPLLRVDRMLMVLWTVDSKDFARPGVKRIVYTAVSGARPGAVILFHDGGADRGQTVAALPRIIRLLRRRHYQLVTVPRLLLDDPPPAGQPRPRSLAGG